MFGCEVQELPAQQGARSWEGASERTQFLEARGSEAAAQALSVRCTSPYWLYLQGRPPREVACGHCRACRIARSREWTVRLVHELTEWPVASFVTLTYDPAHVPEGGVSRAELQGFVKRLRAHGVRCKYYGCGEYGEKSMRPHYHLILFGVDWVKDRKVVRCSWDRGFSHFGLVTVDSIRYVTDYIGKAVLGEKAAEVYGGRAEPFCLVSQGLGRAFAERNAEQLRRELGVTLRGKQVGLPRYYCKKLGIKSDDPAVVKKRMENNVELISKTHKLTAKHHVSYEEELEAGRRQSALNLEMREKMRERGN